MRKIFLVIPILFLVTLFWSKGILRAQETGDPASSPSPSPIAGESSGGYFLKVNGIEGESVAEGHEKEIDLLSFSWGETQEGSRKVSMQDFHFTMKVNKASPKLFLACAKGDHITDAVFSVRKNGSSEDYLKVKMSDVLCSSYQTGGGGGNTPVDDVSFNFGKVEYEYKQQKPDGTYLPAVQAGWDLKQNKKQ